jgi:hypothetical protein
MKVTDIPPECRYLRLTCAELLSFTCVLVTRTICISGLICMPLSYKGAVAYEACCRQPYCRSRSDLNEAKVLFCGDESPWLLFSFLFLLVHMFLFSRV